ncbi:MAG: MarR family winged helix-turn-helix transcriptional regulator [Gemmatimonas sp.]|uniref:MarR family winged helix-turn-helix transcriptional regulator n=1 Tax=Gemmatimonas sp. TaxID=1962908 RepID=UPI00391F6FAF
MSRTPGTPASGTTVHALRAAAAHTERMLARALDGFDITAAQVELLQVIGRDHGTGAACSALARQLAAPGPDITRMLDRLETAGLVTRSRDVNDRRVVHTTLTEQGRAVLRDAAPAIEAAEEAVFAGLADHERAALTTLLHCVRRNCPG